MDHPLRVGHFPRDVPLKLSRYDILKREKLTNPIPSANPDLNPNSLLI